MIRLIPTLALLVLLPASAQSQDGKATKRKPKPDEPAQQFELGFVNLSKVPGTWELEIPKNIKRVEMQVIHVLPTKERKYGLNPLYAGVIEVNGKDALRFIKKNRDGTYTIKDGITGNTFIANPGSEGLWLDISPLVQKGKNKVIYTHYAVGDAGINIRYFTK